MVLVRERLADDDVIRIAQFCENLFLRASGKKIGIVMSAEHVQVGGGECGGHVFKMNLVSAQAVDGCNTGKFRNFFRQTRRNSWAGNWPLIQIMTVWRKLPTMMPIAVIIAMAVERAPTRTVVRRKEAARLREASIASTPRSLPRSFEETDVRASTNSGIASADATTRRIAAR